MESANSAALRPGRMLDSAGASPYARAHHNLARLTELLGVWRDKTPKYPEIYYLTMQIEKEIQAMAGGWRAVMESLSWEQWEAADRGNDRRRRGGAVVGRRGQPGRARPGGCGHPQQHGLLTTDHQPGEPAAFYSCRGERPGQRNQIRVAATPASLAPVWAATVAAALDSRCSYVGAMVSGPNSWTAR